MTQAIYHCIGVSARALHKPGSLRWIGLVAGPLAGVAVTLALPESYRSIATTAVDFSFAGRAVAGLMAWMAIWWITEAIDVAATALLPLAILPIGTASAFGSATDAVRAAASPYADQFIFLFLGGFILALSMERWGLHRRIALTTLRFVGTRPMAMIAGFMAVTAVLSMWVSNTATTVMMLPIAISVVALVESKRSGTAHQEDAHNDAAPVRTHFALCLMLGIAYAASVGGIGTLIGTPPNTILAGFIKREYGVEVSFAQWLLIGVPLVVVFVPIIWLLLTRVIYPIDRTPIEGGADLIRTELSRLGPMQPGEWVTFIVFMTTALCWITRPFIAAYVPGLSDSGIAIIASMMLFIIPVSIHTRTFTMNWQTAEKLPWGILILFGGGLSLADAVKRHGVAEFIGAQVSGLDVLPSVAIVVIVATGVIFLTELTSNTATTATLLPILASVAPAIGVDPYLLIVTAAIAASCAFMMPVATPPNAIVFGSGHVTIPQMCKAGLWLNVIGIILVTVLAYAVVVPILVR